MKTLRSQIDARLGSVALERATRRRCERGTPPMAKGGTPTSVRRLNAAALNAAEALARENRLTHHSRNSENHLTYAEALKRSGYVGDNGVVVLSKRINAARVRGAMNLVADALISMSQTQAKEVARIEEEGVDS